MSSLNIKFALASKDDGIVYLHESNVIHRDVKGSNILLTKEGEVKLCDFGLGKKLTQNDDKLYDCVGSSCWMAPELVTANKEDSEKGFYDNRVDVWALGITAIELAEGAAPFRNMQPCRVLFEIVKNPPPALEKISNWTENFHDFIIEAAKVPLKVKPTETVIIETCFKSSADKKLKKIVEEDLANLDRISEETVLSVIEERFQDRQFYTFVGEILVAVNPNEPLDIFGKKFHELYFQKSRSNNLPHIYSVADTAYQNAMHHKIPQQLILTGESASGKTSNYLHLIDHLFFIGEQHPVNVSRIRNGINLIHALTHANTSTNVYSTSGNKYAINLLDIFGFECFKENHLPQFLVNCLNEQFQYHYIQKVFRAETQDLVSEDIEFETQTFFDNKTTLNHLLSKPDGVLSIIDEASKKNLSGHYIMDNLQRLETNRIVVKSYMEFAVAHFTGRVSYNSREMSDKNRDFLPAEVIETLRESENPIIRSLFLNKLDKTGCLVLNFDRTRRNKRTAQNKNVNML
ncbi:hypothetical protein D910_09677 [Dendroctonus ponderosae]|uniref:Protein kinase domain-containing protein n=1 Tax=Dendroctonus ponderosae TaxID=77166 RepID=U4UIY1_DENPD|nr:hypothetical protein D910_09677 [Dendroctonus ponderosae]